MRWFGRKQHEHGLEREIRAGLELEAAEHLATAGFIPAWRAFRIDPMAALRCD